MIFSDTKNRPNPLPGSGDQRLWGELNLGICTAPKTKELLVGGLEYYIFFHILGRIIPFDKYFSEGLKPPTRKLKNCCPPNHLKSTSCGTRWTPWLNRRQEAYEKTVGVGGKLDNILTAGMPRGNSQISAAEKGGLTWINQQISWCRWICSAKVSGFQQE